MNEKITLNGMPYNAVGERTSPCLIRSNGIVRIQCGNKILDLVKNGELNFNSDFIYQVDTFEDIKKDGIYINGDEVRLCFKKKQYNLTEVNSTNTLTENEKLEELKTLGLIFNTEQELIDAKKQVGFAYVIENDSFYTIQKGVCNKLTSSTNTQEQTETELIKPTFTSGMIMMFSGTSIPEGWAICDGQEYIYNNTFITTPNLTDKFIKAVNNSSEIGESSTTLVKQSSSEETDVYSLIFIMKL